MQWRNCNLSELTATLTTVLDFGNLRNDPDAPLQAKIAEERIDNALRGMMEGFRSGLIRLLTRRFGALPSEVLQRIMRADAPELEAWSDQVLDAATLDEAMNRVAASHRSVG